MRTSARQLVELLAKEVARQLLAGAERSQPEKKTPSPVQTTRARAEDDAVGERRRDES